MTTPWYLRTHRWGQTNLTEVEPLRYDRTWWREYWLRTHVEGLIINAGGIVAYYPTRFELQRRAQGVDQRDLLAEIVEDAHSAGLTVLARMDSNRATQDFYDAHPDWFCVDADGAPITAGDKYISCVNSDYYDEYLPDVFREIIDHVRPDGFGDNSWAGLGRSAICYCDNCARSFRESEGQTLPSAHDESDEVYRNWIEWNYRRRLEIWRMNNTVTRDVGGPECLWIGMIGGDMAYNRERFVDVRALAAESPMLLLDHQRRIVREGFAQNAEVGLRMATMLDENGRYAESMPMYQLGGPVMRLGAMPNAEARLWMTEGIAGGILPWWHHIGAFHDDRRQYETAAPIFQWHHDHEDHLVGRTPLASVAVVWSRVNNDLAGGAAFKETVAAAYRGAWQALSRARIPYVPVHADDLRTLPSSVRAIVLPDLVVMSDEQIAAVRDFVAAGGGLVASGETSLRDTDGTMRENFGLADVLGVNATAQRLGGTDSAADDIETFERHTYLRIDGDAESRWAALARLGDTDIVGFGGKLTVVEPASVDAVPLRYIPAFPIYPPETAWMRDRDSVIPAATIREAGEDTGRVVYLAADLDRCWGRDELPDHGDIIAGAVEWVLGGTVPVRVTGRGELSVVPWRKGEQVVVHLGNVTATSRTAGREDVLIPSAELEVEVEVDRDNGAAVRVTALVGGKAETVVVSDGFVRVKVPPIFDHEVLVFEPEDRS